jgi:3',5'-cyclic AMP phosphodiesterase CpdA
VKLYAISDLHLAAEANRRALLAMPRHGDDWLILAGDIGETEAHLNFAFDVLRPRFRRLIWVPGNHELWAIDGNGLRGEAKYASLVALCRRYDVLTPEDPFPEWHGDGGTHLIAPMFLLYDYTFAPSHIAPHEAVAWAEEEGVSCADEVLLHPDPYPSRGAWCHARCASTERRLEGERIGRDMRLVIVNHFPLKSSLAWLPAIPRFRIWCGTRRTEDWHTRYGASVVVSGHLHIRQSVIVDGVRFEEVSLGYPRQWRRDQPIEAYLRQILPASS